ATCRDLANDVVPVDNVETAVRTERKIERAVDGRGIGPDAVARVARCTCTHDRVDEALRSDPSNHVRRGLGDIDAVATEANLGRRAKPRCGGSAPGARRGRACDEAGPRGNGPRGRDLADAAIVTVGD